jgi:hypothetical protein
MFTSCSASNCRIGWRKYVFCLRKSCGRPWGRTFRTRALSTTWTRSVTVCTDFTPKAVAVLGRWTGPTLDGRSSNRPWRPRPGSRCDECAAVSPVPCHSARVERERFPTPFDPPLFAGWTFHDLDGSIRWNVEMSNGTSCWSSCADHDQWLR